MLRAIIFDLDNCLSAADEVGRGLLEPVFDAIRRANKGALPGEALGRAFEDCWRRPPGQVAREYGFTEEMLAAGWEVAARTEVEAPMRGYPERFLRNHSVPPSAAGNSSSDFLRPKISTGTG